MRDGEKTRIGAKTTKCAKSDLKDCVCVNTARTWAWQSPSFKQCVTTDLPNIHASKIEVAYARVDASMIAIDFCYHVGVREGRVEMFSSEFMERPLVQILGVVVAIMYNITWRFTGNGSVVKSIYNRLVDPKSHGYSQ